VAASKGSASGGSKAVGQVLAKAWSDEGFKRRLKSDPEAVLKEHGLNTGGKKVRVVENSDTVQHFVLPPKPHGAQTSGGSAAAWAQMCFCWDAAAFGSADKRIAAKKGAAAKKSATKTAVKATGRSASSAGGAKSGARR
jgi:hypothetical protein